MSMMISSTSARSSSTMVSRKSTRSTLIDQRNEWRDGRDEGREIDSCVFRMQSASWASKRFSRSATNSRRSWFKRETGTNKPTSLWIVSSSKISLVDPRRAKAPCTAFSMAAGSRAGVKGPGKRCVTYNSLVRPVRRNSSGVRSTSTEKALRVRYCPGLGCSKRKCCLTDCEEEQ